MEKYQLYTESGNYIFNTMAINGCDNLANLSLTLSYSDESFDTIASCNITYGMKKFILSQETIYSILWLLMDDSIANLNLTINYSNESFQSLTACDSYVWNGQTYIQSGYYTILTQTVNGCDSTANLDLFIPEFEPFSLIGTSEVIGGTSSSYTINQNGLEYFWEVSQYGEIISGQGTNSVIINWDDVSSQSQVCVYAIDQYGCNSNKECLNINIDKITFIDDAESLGIKIYPNPFINLSIDLSGCKQKVLIISIYDIQAKKFITNEI